MKHTFLLVIVFAIGVGVGAVAYPMLATSPACHPATTSRQWNETEEDTRCRMSGFQVRLERLEAQPTPDSFLRLSQDMNAQRDIDDVLTKYRDAQQAKFVSFQTAITALVGGLLGFIGKAFLERRSRT
jgi:hypothetical protein